MASPSGKDELRALVALLTTSVDAILNSDAELPSLSSTDSTQLKRTPEVQTALAACAQLSALLEGPAGVGRLGLSFHIPACIRVAIEAHVAEAIREGAAGGGGDGLHVTEIAKASNINSAKLARVLRFLCSQHVFRETSEDTFANNRPSIGLDTGKPLSSIMGVKSFHSSTPGLQALLCHLADEMMKGSSHLAEHLLDPSTADSDSPTSTAINRALGFKMSLWDWFKMPGNEFRQERFAMAMKGVKTLSSDGEFDPTSGFAWGELEEGAKVVDVGGGVGSVSLAITKTFPNLRVVLQDQAQVIQGEAAALWAKEDPDALSSGRVTLQAHDFFTPQPVKDASVFLLRFIIHDWADHQAKEILAHLRDAAKSNTKLILVEQIMQPLCPADQLAPVDVADARVDDLPPAPPAPLLPNGGATLTYLADITMMTGLNALERTLTQFVRLGAESGWKLERVHRPKVGGRINQLVFSPA